MRLRFLIAMAVLVGCASSQVAYTLEDTGTAAGGSPATYLPSGGYPNGGNDPRGPIPLAEYANLPAASPMGADVGGYCIDQKRGRIFSCNGFNVQAEGHPLYSAPAIASSAGLGVYFQSNTITGMAVCNGNTPGLLWDPIYGTVVSELTGKDDGLDVAPIGFNFPFGGQTYTHVGMNSNGGLTLGDSTLSHVTGGPGYLEYDPDLSLYLSNPSPALAAFWTDLTLVDMGKVYYKAGSGVLTITWDGVGSYQSSLMPFTFQVKMYDDGRIMYSYNGISDIVAHLGENLFVGVTTGGSASDPGGNDYTAEISFTSAGAVIYEQTAQGTVPFDLDQRSILFTPAGSGYAVSWATGNPTSTLYCVDDKHLRSFDVSGDPAIFTPQQGQLSPIHLSWLNSDANLTGLGCESSTGLLWACDSLGNIYRMTTDGVPVGPQPVATVNSVGTLSGLAVNTTNGPGSMASSFCSFQVQGYHIMVTDGQYIYDALNPIGVPLPIAGGTGTTRGLAYSSDGQLIPASSACPLNGGAVGNPNTGSGAPSGIRTQQVAASGNGGNGLELNGGPPNSQASLLFDLCPIQNGGVPLPTGDTLYIWVLSPTLVVVPTGTDAFGTGTFTLPIGAAPAGVQFSYQWYFQDVANPTLYGCFSDAMTVTVGLP